MIVKDAKEVVRYWVADEGSRTPGFDGAFFHGSVNWLGEDADLPATSDIDVMLVLTSPAPLQKRGKFLFHDVLLEVSYIPADEVRSPETVLGNYPLAGSFRGPSIISAPSGWLTDVQKAVAKEYTAPFWVRERCRHAENNVRRFLKSLEENTSASFSEQVSSWLFAAGVTVHILLVAGLKNPTVRKRYVAVRELLGEYDLSAYHETLLETLGCAHLSRVRAEEHLVTLMEAFDTTSALIATPYRFAADMSAAARPIAIDGSRELIEKGLHREAIFWMLAVYSRCQWILAQDAPPAVQEKISLGYRSLLADLGITSYADLRQRGQQVKDSLPTVWRTAEAILSSNPAIHIQQSS